MDTPNLHFVTQCECGSTFIKNTGGVNETDVSNAFPQLDRGFKVSVFVLMWIYFRAFILICSFNTVCQLSG